MTQEKSIGKTIDLIIVVLVIVLTLFVLGIYFFKPVLLNFFHNWLPDYKYNVDQDVSVMGITDPKRLAEISCEVPVAMYSTKDTSWRLSDIRDFFIFIKEKQGWQPRRTQLGIIFSGDETTIGVPRYPATSIFRSDIVIATVEKGVIKINPENLKNEYLSLEEMVRINGARKSTVYNRLFCKSEKEVSEERLPIGVINEEKLTIFVISQSLDGRRNIQEILDYSNEILIQSRKETPDTKIITIRPDINVGKIPSLKDGKIVLTNKYVLTLEELSKKTSFNEPQIKEVINMIKSLEGAEVKDGIIYPKKEENSATTAVQNPVTIQGK